MFAVLSKEDILKMLEAKPPLVENLCDINQQVQPNGIDLTLKEVALLSSPGSLGPNNEARVISSTSPLAFDNLGRIDLLPGCYLVTFNEVVNIPNNIMAMAMPRSSLLRCGVSVHNAVWDAGYSGRSQALMVVYNPQGFRLHRDTRIIQMVFFSLSHEVAEGYRGIFQGENIWDEVAIGTSNTIYLMNSRNYFHHCLTKMSIFPRTPCPTALDDAVIATSYEQQ